MSELKTFWSYTIADGSNLMLEQPQDCNVVITQVSLLNPQISQRVILSASIEALRPDKPPVNGELDADDRDFVITSFCPNDSPTKFLNIAFTPMEICYLSATGGDVIVSGYIMKSTVKFTRFSIE
ncbi:hypothetical protein GPJ56_001572 [Histomonas meleagridis]|uniref:uncharacterized protein n=1 Tax=Histomonas meleagridis TaxID=135588 RepID=UPI003559C27E|nr:hypothetical protein GPJ56_001572 [Histomonas meleagridis]KAH0807078.1 hypothetical protein GO595_000254 [Histomonas meleagridis]